MAGGIRVFDWDIMQDELTDEQLAELQDPDTWDWENGVVVYPEPGRRHGIRLGVLIEGEAIEVLESAARAAGMTLADYVLAAALEKARQGTSAS